ncbi:MAG TPA: hypothetical protein VGJ91_21510, partial [Polyangiaceae bacterium]
MKLGMAAGRLSVTMSASRSEFDSATPARTPRCNAGGSAAAGGIDYQGDVAAYFAVLILAEQDAQPPLGLPANVTLEGLVAETVDDVDDLKIATSAGGFLFVQAKRSLRFSTKEDSEFGGVMRQFVSQFRANVAEGPNTRPVEQSRDRLVLAVGPGTPNSIRVELKSMLDRVRPALQSPMLHDAVSAMSAKLRARFESIVALLGRVWEHESRSPADETQIEAILKLTHVLSLDLASDGPQLELAKGHLRRSVLQDPTHADAAWNAIVTECRQFSTERTGGNRAHLRALLEASSIPSNAPRSFRPEIDRLRRRTADWLAELEEASTIPIQGRRVHIVRSVFGELGSAASLGDALVVGCAGSGKSACVYDFAKSVLNEGGAVVLLAANRIEGQTLHHIGIELGLPGGSSLVDVLANWPSIQRGYLVIDALDAA